MMKRIVINIVLISLIIGGCTSGFYSLAVLPHAITGTGPILRSAHYLADLLQQDTEPDTQATPVPDIKVTETPVSSSFLTHDSFAGWKWMQPFQVINTPVLLYHHISDEPKFRNYAVSIKDFSDQMSALKARGYETVTISSLVNAIKFGAPLPERPVVITFDDGTLDVYQNAYPVMQALGFVGTFYLVGNYIDSPDYVSTEQVKNLLEAGWEIGSHSMTHADLSKTMDLNRELYGSKEYLEKAFNVPINTIAYPFGMVNPQVFEKTIDYGYSGASGLGLSWEHSYSSVYYLNRIEIKYGQSLEAFNELMPW